jgi:methylglutaconyl-CoA hydratase
MSTLITTTRNAAAVSIILNRPDLHNALNDVMMRELTDCMLRYGADDSVRAILLRGDGKSFCAGADVNWMRRMIGYSLEENVSDATVLAQMLRAIRECPKPVIARVHGACIGGGVGLAAACDIVGACDAAVFCLSEVKLGIIPAVISPYVLEKIGMSAMRRLALTAERFPAALAVRIGLVHESHASEQQLDAWIASQIELIVQNGPEALACCKRLLRDVAESDWDALQTLTTRRIAERRVSTEGQEGLRSFLDKRPPKWAGGSP